MNPPYGNPGSTLEICINSRVSSTRSVLLLAQFAIDGIERYTRNVTIAQVVACGQYHICTS